MQRLAHPRPQVGWPQNLNIGTKSQDIAQKFPFVRVGNLQDKAAVNRLVRPLVRMPLLARYPTRPLWGEFELSPGLRGTRKYAIAGLHHPAQMLRLDDMGRFRLNIAMLNGINSKAAQVIAEVAPAVQVPGLDSARAAGAKLYAPACCHSAGSNG